MISGEESTGFGGEGGRESLLLCKYILYPDSWRRLRFLLPVPPTMVSRRVVLVGRQVLLRVYY
jgi:hypothetical protein